MSNIDDDKLGKLEQKAKEANSIPPHIFSTTPTTVLAIVREVLRFRDTLAQIRDITDPETETAQPPMAAIREVLEDIDDR